MKLNRQQREDLYIAWINQICVVCDTCGEREQNIYQIMVNYDQKIIWCPDCDGIS